MQTLIARLLGREHVDSIDSVGFSFGADWAHDGPAWLLFGWLGLAFVSAWFYLKYQQRASRRRQVSLGLLRGTLLCLLLLILADPILEAFVIGCFAEDRVLAVKVRDSAHADEELRAGRVRVGRPSHRKNT